MSPVPIDVLHPLEGQRVASGSVSLYVTQQGAGPPLVFLHGLGWQHGLWRRQIARYAPRYRVVAGDNRGHGRSDKPPGPYSIRGMAEDWLRALDALGLEKCCLIGFSQGGMIALWMSVLAPERFAALAVIGSSCKGNPAAQAIMEARLAAAEESARAAAEAAAASIFSPEFMARERLFIDAFVADRAAMPTSPLAAATRALFDFDVSGELGRISCPTLVAVGDRDRLVSVAAAREISDRIAGARFLAVASAAHMVSLEQPVAFDRMLDDFLATEYPPSRNVNAGEAP